MTISMTKTPQTGVKKMADGSKKLESKNVPAELAAEQPYILTEPGKIQEAEWAARQAANSGQPAPTPHPGDVAFKRLIWRLQMASHKLDLATTHWKVPAECCSEDLGAVMTVHEVARELDGLYCRFAELIREHGLYKGSLSADSFDEGAPEPAYQEVANARN